MKLKAIFIFFIVIAIAFSFLIMELPEEASATQNGHNIRENYKLEIVFGNFYLASGRILQSFSVTFDDDYFNQIEEKEELLKDISLFLRLVGFTPEIDYNGRVLGKLEYESATDWEIKNERDGYKNYGSLDYREEKDFFFRKIFSEKKTIFAGINGDNDTIDYLLFMLGTHLFNLSIEDIAFGYHYGTPYKIISTNAEKRYFDNKARIYVHEFQMDIHTADREIMMIQKVPNVVNWYLLAIIITIPFIVVPFIMAIYLKRRERKGLTKGESF